MASYLINCIPDIENKRYLELGVHAGSTFNAVMSKRKASVDNAMPAGFQMTTDEFFAQLGPGARWDVIYIDACHEYHQVVRDYNNAIKHLEVGGVIFLHDLVPPDESHTAQHYCGDAYRLLYQWLCGYDDPRFYVLYRDYGLTAVVGDFKAVSPISEPVPFNEFRELLSQARQYSVEEMQAILRSL